MNVKVNVQRTFKIDRKEYRSLDEMPPEVRAAVRAAMGKPLGASAQRDVKVTFNGRVFGGGDEMPAEVRGLYASALEAAKAAAAPGGQAGEPSKGGGGRLTDWPTRSSSVPVGPGTAQTRAPRRVAGLALFVAAVLVAIVVAWRLVAAHIPR